MQVENDEDDGGKTSPNLHRRNFLKFSIQNILSASARERQGEGIEEEEEDEGDKESSPREPGVRIVRPLVTSW